MNTFIINLLKLLELLYTIFSRLGLLASPGVRESIKNAKANAHNKTESLGNAQVYMYDIVGATVASLIP